MVGPSPEELLDVDGPTPGDDIDGLPAKYHSFHKWRHSVHANLPLVGGGPRFARQLCRRCRANASVLEKDLPQLSQGYILKQSIS